MQIITYPGSIPQAAHPLLIQRDSEIERGYLAQLVFGTSTVVDGLACTPANAGIGVVIDRGVICQLGVIDPTGIGVSLPADPRALMKIGVNPDVTPFGLSVPAVAGQAQNFVIEAKWSSLDTTPVVLPYVNTANPAQPFSGPGGTGAAQNTLRNQFVDLQLLVGAPGVVGSQPTPGIDSGWVGLWIVTARAGATSILPSDITEYPGAPFVSNKLQSVVSPAALAAETAARIAADNNLQAELNAEAVTRNNEDGVLLAAINAEAVARNNADNAEALARNNEDTNLQNEINAEAAVRAEADSAEAFARASIRPGYPNLVAFEAPGDTNFVVPAGITILKVTAIGAGGGGGGSPTTTGPGTFSGGGGGAGAGAIAYTAVTPGQVIPITVGAGGAGGSAGGHAGNGSTTSVGGFLSATGGGGGNDNENAAGGFGGTPYGSVLGFLGGDGSDGGVENLSGGNGGSGIFGGGGRAGTGGGGSGTAPGSGGGSSYSGVGAPGGSGANGLVIIEF